MRLEPDFDDVGRASHTDGNCPSHQPSQNLLRPTSVFVGAEGTRDRVSDGYVKAVAEANEEELSLQSRPQPVKQGSRSLFRHHELHALKHGGVLRLLARDYFLDLKSDLGGV